MILRFLLLLLLAAPAWAAPFGPGRLEHLRNFPSAHVDPRDVTVWLPPDYDPNGAPYAVLYMHDGQNLFDPATSYTGIDWGVDEAWREGRGWISRNVPGAAHTGQAWRARVDVPLRFLLPPDRPDA